ncbi:hypothetical protein L5515_018637 [Caenorhabditis briggsae]|uniref:Uncharacterized protein n=1 Tax=Caenorhabditis briggsae TaxID=6238 RepID=A0AAE9JSX5_CAEBR|nr:hypothetical protein L5515_018637 [Caenorhabditis briggsae]
MAHAHIFYHHTSTDGNSASLKTFIQPYSVGLAFSLPIFHTNGPTVCSGVILHFLHLVSSTQSFLFLKSDRSGLQYTFLTSTLQFTEADQQ